MNIQEILPGNRKLIQQFLSLPKDIYRDIPQWVPPLTTDLAHIFDRRGNPFYRQSQAVFFLAQDTVGQPIGRLAVLDNVAYNQYNQEKTAFFFLFECQNDPVSSKGLFEAGFAWAKKQGLNRILGPKGFSALDGLGLLTKGFQHRPAFGIPYNPPYYASLIEAAGFQRISDIVSGYLSPHTEFPEKIHQISTLVQQRRGLHIAHYKNRQELFALIPKLQQLYNNTLSGTGGNAPLTDAEARSMANQLLWFADPRLIKVVMKGNEPVGFLFAYPDISEAVRRTGGKMFPFGWISMLSERSRTKWVNINGAGITEHYRGLGGTAILFSEMQKSIVEGGFEHADLVQIGVENDKMQRELRGLGIDFYKTHTMYQRNIG
jgi:hypothetical protein